MSDAGTSAPVLLPLVFGNCAAYLTSGIIMSQAVAYHQLHYNDSKWVRAPIYTILALNLWLLVVGLSRETKVVGFHFGDLPYLVSFHSRPEDLMVGILSILITACCQLFLVVRSFLFTRALYGREISIARFGFTASKLLFITLGMAFGFSATYFLFQFPNYAEVNKYNNVKFLSTQKYPLFEMLWIVSTSIADLLICISMSIDLHKAKTGNRDSNSILQTLINLSLRNGFFLLLTALTSALLYFLAGAGWTDATLLFLPRLGTITVLSSITSPKEAFRAQQRRDEGRGTTLSNVSNGSSGRCVCGNCTCVQRRPSVRMRIKEKATLASCRSARLFDDVKSGATRNLERDQAWTAPSQRSKGDGVQISTTSRIDVEENNLNLADIGNFVRIHGPSTPASHVQTQRSTRELPTHDYLPSRANGNTHSITSGTLVYDPDRHSEYELPLMKIISPTAVVGLLSHHKKGAKEGLETTSTTDESSLGSTT